MEYKKRQTQFILSFAFALTFALVFQFPQIIKAQIVSTSDKADSSALVYLDLQNGMTADEAVTFALENNGELQALRKEVEAARALIKQAGMRANPKLETNGARQIGGTDNSRVCDCKSIYR